MKWINSLIFLLLLICITAFSEDYLVITHESLYSPAWWNTFENLKQEQGYNVFIHLLTDGKSCADIRQIIEQSSPLPDFILLIGDASETPDSMKEIASESNGNFIPFHYRIVWAGYTGPDSSPIATDDYYIEELSNTYIGRVPASSSEQVLTWINKLVSQEKGRILYETWKNRVLMVTANTDHPSNGCVGKYRDEERDTITARYLNPSGVDVTFLNSADFSTEYGYLPEKALAFEEAVNMGQALISAMGVGSDWSALVDFYWTFPYPESNWNFTNLNMYSFLFGNCCSIGKVQKVINGNEIETVMQKLMFLDYGGIIGAIAPTYVTGTYKTRLFAYNLFEEVLLNDYNCIGKALKTVKDSMAAERYGPSRLWQLRATLLFGDPSMTLPLYQKKCNDITESTEWSGSIIIERPLTIAPGTTLRIRPGTGIFFKPGASLIVKGDFTAEGTEDFPILFAAATEEPQHGFWQGLVIGPDDNQQGQVSLRHVEIRDAVNGLRLYRESGQVTISNSRIHDNSSSGIHLEECNGSITLKDNEIDHNDGNGLDITHSRSISLQENSIHHNSYSGVLAYRESVVDMKGNHIHSNGSSSSDPRHCGIYSSAGSIVYLLMNGNDNGVIENCESNNWIYDNSCCGVLADEGSYPELGIYDEDFAYIYGGLNRIYGQPVDVWNANRSGKIYAQVNYWQWDKFSPCEGSSPAHIEGEVVWSPAMPLPDVGNSPEELLLSGIKAENSGDLNAASYFYQEVLNTAPDSPLSAFAISGIVRCLEKQGDEEEIISVMRDIIEDNPETEASRYALDQIMVRKVENKQYSEALAIGDTLENLFSESSRAGLYVYEEGRIYEQMNEEGGLGKYARLAINCYERAYREYPGSVGGYLSGLKLGKTIVNPYHSLMELPDLYTLQGVYPNPFNSETRILFDLPEVSMVRIEVYNLLGHRVRTLGERIFDSGCKYIIWDGCDDRGRQLSSGIYLLHFSVRSLKSNATYTSKGKCILLR